MNRTMPMWYAQPRGTAITALAVLDGDDDDRGFLPELGHRLTNLVNGGPAAVIGFLFVLSSLIGLPAAGGTANDALAALLALVPIAWCAAGASAGLLVFTRHDDAPPWASALVSFMTITGKIVATVFVVTTLVVSVFMALAMLMGISSIGRER